MKPTIFLSQYDWLDTINNGTCCMFRLLQNIKATKNRTPKCNRFQLKPTMCETLLCITMKTPQKNRTCILQRTSYNYMT